MDKNEQDEEKIESKETGKPSLAIIIGLCCAVLTVVQGLCSLSHIEVAMNVMIDIVSLALTVLVSLKIVKSDKTGSPSDIMADIKSDINSSLKKNKKQETNTIVALSSTKEKAKSKSSKTKNKDKNKVE